MSVRSDSPSPAEAEADAEQARAGLVTTLNQLRENLLPANVVEEVMTHAKVNASAISEQIWGTARRHPIPAVMIGAGLAMIFGVGTRAMSPRPSKVTSHDRPEPVDGSVGPEFAAHIARPASQSLGAEKSALGSAFDHVKMQAGDLLDTANERLADTTSRASSMARTIQSNATIGDPMSSLRSRDRLLSNISKVIEEQPLILAAIGVAVGAAIGAAIPQTDTENSLMGERSHSVRDAADELIQDQYAQLKSAATHGVDDIKQTVADHGVNTDNLSGLVRDVGEKAKAATYEAGQSLDPSH